MGQRVKRVTTEQKENLERPGVKAMRFVLVPKIWVSKGRIR